MANFRAFVPLALLCVHSVACVDVPVDPAPADRVQAVFDPDAAVIPLPNTAALDDDGTLPDLGGEGAQGEFHKWLSRSYGWDPATPITIPFDGKLDASSLSDAVTLYRVTSSGGLEELDATVSYAENVDGSQIVCNPTVCASVVIVTPSAPLVAGQTYAAVATDNIKGSNGLPVLASSAMFYAASPTPLTDASGRSQIASLDDGTARSLDGLRGLLGPVFEALRADGVAADRVVAANTWTTSTNAFTILDPATATLPFRTRSRWIRTEHFRVPRLATAARATIPRHAKPIRIAARAFANVGHA
ncbi:MAG: hypothetical protein R3E66_10080 [bacterium]